MRIFAFIPAAATLFVIQSSVAQVAPQQAAPTQAAPPQVAPPPAAQPNPFGGGVPPAAIESIRRAAFEEGQRAAAARPAAAPNTNLQEFVRGVRGLGRNVLIDARVPEEIYVGGSDLRNPDYADLLSILKLNGLAAVEIGNQIQIVPEAIARTLPTPIVQNDNADIPDDAVVTRVIEVRNYSAASLVPILRPMMPQMAQFAAQFDPDDPQAGKLVIVDRYANVRRISAVIRELTE